MLKQQAKTAIVGLLQDVQYLPWVNRKQLSYRQKILIQEFTDSSCIASIQQFKISPAHSYAFKSFQKFQIAINRQSQCFGIEQLSNDTFKITIRNFYPTLLKKLFPKKVNDIFVLAKPIETQNPKRWGYLIEDGNGLPSIFLSGPGRFEYSTQLYEYDESTEILSLLFFAANRPEELLQINGREILFSSLKKISRTPKQSTIAKLSEACIQSIERQMINIHHRVHFELVADMLKD